MNKLSSPLLEAYMRREFCLYSRLFIPLHFLIYATVYVFLHSFEPLFGEVVESKTHKEHQEQASRDDEEFEHCVLQTT